MASTAGRRSLLKLRERARVGTLAVLFLFSSLGTGSAFATTLTLSGSSESLSREIYSSGGGWTDFSIVGNCVSTEFRGLLQFDVAGNLPVNADVQSVQLKLWVNSDPSSEAESITLHREFTAWNSAATWLTPDGTAEWEGGYPEFSAPYYHSSYADGFLTWDLTGLPLLADAGGYMLANLYGACVGIGGHLSSYPPELTIEYD